MKQGITHNMLLQPRLSFGREDSAELVAETGRLMGFTKVRSGIFNLILEIMIFDDSSITERIWSFVWSRLYFGRLPVSGTNGWGIIFETCLLLWQGLFCKRESWEQPSLGTATLNTTFFTR